MSAFYPKLVRDKIPEIIKKQGNIPHIEKMNSSVYYLALQEKLKEETEEYFSDKTVEELADILEVVYALAACHNLSITELEDIRMKKHETNGGFAEHFRLLSIEQKK